ncbi:MAG: formylglycine-generating enzyme family protein [Desulfobacterota bacterium]|nr:formylglycine-generating enzyme family protein [Thermodesulfobacteriota bacterium]
MHDTFSSSFTHDWTSKAFIWLAIVCGVVCGSACSSSSPPPAHDPPAPYPDMIFIPAGECLIGDSIGDGKTDERPAHSVFLDAFYIDRYEVTNKQYQVFLRATGHPPPHVAQQWAEPYNWQGTDYPEGCADKPVVLVSWYDAQQYCAWLGKRLPTEAEWEKAARGGLIGKRYPCGDILEHSDAGFDKGFFRSKTIMPVGSFKPNGFGLFDMAGNVWEWCQDWYDEGYYKNAPRINPQGPDNGTYRVFRGGAWNSDERFLRCSQRGKNVPEYKSYSLGFRCALTAQPGAQKPGK